MYFGTANVMAQLNYNEIELNYVNGNSIFKRNALRARWERNESKPQKAENTQLGICGE